MTPAPRCARRRGRSAAGAPDAERNRAGDSGPGADGGASGASDEVLIFNTHTDGQGFAEENGGVAFVQLARHFASLPVSRRLKRTVVFAAWPGHMTYDLLRPRAGSTPIPIW